MVEAIDSVPRGARITYISERERGLATRILDVGGEEWVDRYLRLVVVMLMVRSLIRGPDCNLPPPVDALLARARGLILDNAMSPHREPYRFDAEYLRDR